LLGEIRPNGPWSPAVQSLPCLADTPYQYARKERDHDGQLGRNDG